MRVKTKYYKAVITLLVFHVIAAQHAYAIEDETSNTARKIVLQDINLKTSVGSRKSMQTLGVNGESEKRLVTNKVASNFSDSPLAPVSCMSFSRATEVTRILSKPPANECVVLLHGLGRTNGSLTKMAEDLIASGYLVANVDYPSRKKSIEELAYIAVPEGLKICQNENASKIHFVTHSMGGIVLRYYLKNETIVNLGRVVMLSPPNGGSLLVDQIADWTLYKWFNGPAGQQLGTGAGSVPLSLGPVTYETGIITGSEHSFFDAWAAKIIPGEDDGKVSIEHAKVDGMTDFIVVPHAHSFIMNKNDVIWQTQYFLLNGRFDTSSR